jgi:hypothetical protein
MPSPRAFDEFFDGVAVHLFGRSLGDEEVGVGLVHIDAGAGFLSEVVFQEFDEHGGCRNGWLRGQCRHPPPGLRPERLVSLAAVLALTA